MRRIGGYSTDREDGMTRHAIHTAIAALTLALAPRADAEIISVAPRDSAGLIAALDYANRTPGEDIIELAAGSLYLVGDGANALPTIRSRIRILGNRAEIRRYAEGRVTLLTVAPAGHLRAEFLTLAEGTQGAIVNRGHVELHHVAISDNTAVGAQAIVTNFGTFVATDTGISNNEIAGAQRDAGIVLNYGDVTLRDCVFADNAVSRRYDSVVAVAGVLNFGRATLTRVALGGNIAPEPTDEKPLVDLGNGRTELRDVRLVAQTGR
jgi:hypothetical protein